jgi:hypothetical protein
MGGNGNFNVSLGGPMIKTCSACGGSGHIWFSGGNDDSTAPRVCLQCNGNGWVFVPDDLPYNYCPYCGHKLREGAWVPPENT